jgi:hypothetical protein
LLHEDQLVETQIRAIPGAVQVILLLDAVLSWVFDVEQPVFVVVAAYAMDEERARLAVKMWLLVAGPCAGSSGIEPDLRCEQWVHEW